NFRSVVPSFRKPRKLGQPHLEDECSENQSWASPPAPVHSAPSRQIGSAHRGKVVTNSSKYSRSFQYSNNSLEKVHASRRTPSDTESYPRGPRVPGNFALSFRCFLLDDCL